ncbi:hypothetical protein MMC10_009703 [Thelotrema lepadinum]|nr:hypothetical protein [Thelotrema lepadinum]
MTVTFLDLPREIRLEIYQLADWLPSPKRPKLMYIKAGSKPIRELQDPTVPFHPGIYRICKTISQDLPSIRVLVATQAIIPTIRFNEHEGPYWTHHEPDECLDALLPAAPILRFECNSAVLRNHWERNHSDGSISDCSSPVLQDPWERSRSDSLEFGLAAWQRSSFALDVLTKFLEEAPNEFHNPEVNMKAKIIKLVTLDTPKLTGHWSRELGTYFTFKLSDMELHRIYSGLWNRPSVLQNLQTITVCDVAGLMAQRDLLWFNSVVRRHHLKYKRMICK